MYLHYFILTIFEIVLRIFNIKLYVSIQKIIYGGKKVTSHPSPTFASKAWNKVVVPGDVDFG